MEKAEGTVSQEDKDEEKGREGAPKEELSPTCEFSGPSVRTARLRWSIDWRFTGLFAEENRR
jgi:hypothetical protein